MIWIFAFMFFFESMVMVKHNVNTANIMAYTTVVLIIVGTICDTIYRIFSEKYKALHETIKEVNKNEVKPINQ